MKVWIIIEEDRIDNISYVVSVWGNKKAAEREFVKLRAANHFGLSYLIDEWEVKN